MNSRRPSVWRGPSFWSFLPTVALLAWSTAGYLQGQISWSVHWPLAAVCYWYSLICAHDAIHRCAHENKLLNDFVGWVTGALYAIPYSVVRRAHVSHHAMHYRGEEEDIEFFAIRGGWSLPLRLLLGNWCYYGIWPSCTGLEKGLAVATATTTAAVFLVWPSEVLIGWFLPMHTSVFWFMLTTIYMPHGPYRDWVDEHLAGVTGFHNAHHALPLYPWYQISDPAVRAHGRMPSKAVNLRAGVILLLLSLGLPTLAPAGGLFGMRPKGEAKARLERLRTELTSIVRNPTGFFAKSEKGAKGLAHILAGRAQTYPMPLSLYRKAMGDKTLVDLWLDDGMLGNPFVSDNKIIPAMGDAVQVDDVGLKTISKTCMLCHAGTAGGQLIAGLPNPSLDLVPMVSRLTRGLKSFDRVEKLITLGQRIPSLDIVEKFSPKKARRFLSYLRDFKSYADDAFLPPLRQSRSRGDNLGPYNVWYLGSKLEAPETLGVVVRKRQTNTTAPLEQLLVDRRLPTIQSMPWWNMKFKERAYWFWDAPYHSPAAFNLNFWTPQRAVDSPETLAAHQAKLEAKVHTIDEVLQFARETEPPALPAPIQEKLNQTWDRVLAGQRLYDGGANSTGKKLSCVSCHGSYSFGADSLVVDYPNTGIKDVATDPGYNDTLQDLAPIAQHINKTAELYGTKYAPSSYVVSKPGYTSPVLVGVWATAPYLHNGSVPTLRHLFEPSAARPTIWGRRIWEPLAYDFEAVGMVYDAIDAETLASLELAARRKSPSHPYATEHRRFFDTRGFGRSAAGHEYGIDLTDEEKQDLVLFLTALTVSPDRPNVVPKVAVPTWPQS